MGIGDEIMALGEAQKLSKASGLPVRITDKDGKPRWAEIWAGQTAIVHPGETPMRSAVLLNAPGARPYIVAWESWKKRPVSVFSRQWRARDCMAAYKVDMSILGRGPLALKRTVIVEHRSPDPSSPNKAIEAKKMSQIVAGLGAMGLRAIHVTPRRAKPDPVTETFWCANGMELMSMMQAGAGYLGVEGGLHHAAAAVGRPAVVLFGGFASPDRTGYAIHENLTGDNGGRPCGRWAPCDHCEKAMGSISVEMVLAAAEKAFREVI